MKYEEIPNNDYKKLLFSQKDELIYLDIRKSCWFLNRIYEKSLLTYINDINLEKIYNYIINEIKRDLPFNDYNNINIKEFHNEIKKRKLKNLFEEN